MAQIKSPDYSKISTRQKVYPVRPAQQEYFRQDEKVDLSSSAMKDAVLEGLEVFSKIYVQSKETADLLQAKNILIEKAKDTQRVKENIKLHIGSTAPEHLQLQNVLNDYRTIDQEGRSKLNLGADRKHNISSMQMPTDINDNVRLKIEDKFVTAEIDIVNYLISQVESVQSQQVEDLLSEEIEVFSNDYIIDTRSNPDKETRRELLQNHLKVLFEKIDHLSTIGTFDEYQITKRKNKVIQIALKTEFRSDMLIEGNKNKAIEDADNGGYFYVMDDGRKISLQRAVIKPYIDARIGEQFKASNDWKDYLSDNEKVRYLQGLEKDVEDNPSKFLNDYGKLEKDKWVFDWDKISKDKKLHQYVLTDLRDKGPDAHGKARTATPEELKTIKGNILHKAFLNAINKHEAELKAQIGEEVKWNYFNNSYIPSVVDEWMTYLVERALAAQQGELPAPALTDEGRPKEVRRNSLTNKYLNTEQLAEEQKLDEGALEIVEIVENMKGWKIRELHQHIKTFNEKFNDDNFHQIRAKATDILQHRIIDLTDNIATTQLRESSSQNKEVLEGGEGEYDMEAVKKWQEKLGITNTNNLVPKSTLAEIKILEDPLTDFNQKLVILNKFTALESKYGVIGSPYRQLAHSQISLNMRAKVNGGMRGLYATWGNYEGRLEQIKHLKGALHKISKQTAEERTNP